MLTWPKKVYIMCMIHKCITINHVHVNRFKGSLHENEPKIGLRSRTLMDWKENMRFV
jgi:hypothetical protein